METYLYFTIIGVAFFILGFFVGFKYRKKNSSKEFNTNLHDNTTRDAIPAGLNGQNSQIRAVQTRGRMGTSVDTPSTEGIFRGVKSKNKTALPHLNFSGIGIASENDKDDLKKIDGIGPFIEQKLNRIGIYTYDQISRFTDYEIETVTKLIEFFPGRIKRDAWKQQATVLLSRNEKRA
ncbi:hypothetical protein ACJD0Z_09795 [Flavobacteriaceae bacterium M23B6Z8]